MGSDDAFNLPPPSEVAWLQESMAQDEWERLPENIDKTKRQLLAEYRPQSIEEVVSLPMPTPAEVLQAMGVEPTGWRIVARNSDGSWRTERTHCDTEADARESAEYMRTGCGWDTHAVPYWTIVGGAE